MSTEESKVVKKPGFFQRTSMYGFELFMAFFGLVTTLIVVDYCIFALVNYIRGAGNDTSYVGEFTIWIIAAMIVWLPVTAVFYLRSRSEGLRNPAHEQSVLFKVLASIYYFCVIIGATGLAFAAIYALVRMAVSPDESATEVLVRVVVPAGLAVLVHIGMMFACPKSNKPSRRVFTTIFVTVAGTLALVLFSISASSIRGAKQDDATLNDLNAIQSSIEIYQSQNSTLPSTLNSLTFSKVDIKERLSKYSYTKVDDTRYDLCATFITDAHDRYNSDYIAADTSVEYKTYASFYSHVAGEQCFKLQADAGQKYYFNDTPQPAPIQ